MQSNNGGAAETSCSVQRAFAIAAGLMVIDAFELTQQLCQQKRAERAFRNALLANVGAEL